MVYLPTMMQNAYMFCFIGAGQLVGRRRVAHLAAAAQARNPSPPLGRLRRGSSAPNLRPAPPAKSAGAEIFEEIMSPGAQAASRRGVAQVVCVVVRNG